MTSSAKPLVEYLFSSIAAPLVYAAVEFVGLHLRCDSFPHSTDICSCVSRRIRQQCAAVPLVVSIQTHSNALLLALCVALVFLSSPWVRIYGLLLSHLAVLVAQDVLHYICGALLAHTVSEV